MLWPMRARMRLPVVDGTSWDVVDTEADEAVLGRPGSGRGSGRSAFPQTRMAALVEVGSRAQASTATGADLLRRCPPTASCR